MSLANLKPNAPVKPTVLVIDDDPGTRFLVGESLYPHGFNIMEADSGEQALYLYEALQPDLVLLDLNMPGIDGFETCVRIRKRRDGQDVPILVITGRDDSESIDAAYSAGASDFIIKPINWPVLIHHVRYMMRAGKAIIVQQHFDQLQVISQRLGELLGQFFMSQQEMLNAAMQIIVEGDGFFSGGIDAAVYLAQDGEIRLAASSKPGYAEFPNLDITTNDIGTANIDQHGNMLLPLSTVDKTPAPSGFSSLYRYNLCTLNNCLNRAQCQNANLIGLLLIQPNRPNLLPSTDLRLFAPITDKLTQLIRQVQSQLELYLTAQVFENSSEAIVITTADTNIVRVNSSFEKITGYRSVEVLGKPISILKSARQDEHFYRDFWYRLNHEGRWQGEIWNRRKNGDVYPEWLSISAIKNQREEVTHYMGIFTDTSALKEQERQLQQLTLYDKLTGLPNRLMFDTRLREAVRASAHNNSSLAVLCIDIDRFKHINESFGHDYGDQLLIAIATRLQSCLAKNDMIARQSGDEFIILLADLSTDASIAQRQIKVIAEHIHQRIREPLQIGQYELYLSASVGIASTAEQTGDVAELLRQADIALYRAKDKGKNRHQFYSPTLSKYGIQHFLLEAALRKAIEKGELYLHFQPQLAIDSDRAVSAEALLRWRNPQFGEISPLDFIPLAEETALIVDIGNWVANAVCEQLAEWQKSGFWHESGLKHIAVNVSPIQFLHADFITNIERLLRKYPDCPPSWLELELTESCLMGNSEESIQLLAKLRKMGLRISLDDFGTGYSSLNYLKNFPLDTLKIDQSFVKGCVETPSNAAIVRAVIAMASGLQLDTVAEGVETQTQLDFLRQHHCKHYQGFLKSKPLTACDFETFVRCQNIP